MDQLSNLFIDIGHSAVKWKTPDTSVSTQLIENFSPDLLPQCATVWLSHVAHQDIADGIKSKFFSVVVIRTPAEFKTLNIAYPAPNELGVDRFLAMLGAQNYHPNKNLLIIDIGSALTIDIVADTGEHQGGLIMPGLATLRYSFEKFATSSNLKGFSGLHNNTKESWLGGTESMIIASVKNHIDDFLERYTNAKIILTGGDVKIISSAINVDIELYENLVLDGIEYYAKTSS